MIQDLFCEKLRFGSGHRQILPGFFQLCQYFRNARVNGVLKNTTGRIILPVICDRLRRLLMIESVKFLKGLDKRRADKALQIFICFCNAIFF